jgi:hypothetical protein
VTIARRPRTPAENAAATAVFGGDQGVQVWRSENGARIYQDKHKPKKRQASVRLLIREHRPRDGATSLS